MACLPNFAFCIHDNRLSEVVAVAAIAAGATVGVVTDVFVVVIVVVVLAVVAAIIVAVVLAAAVIASSIIIKDSGGFNLIKLVFFASFTNLSKKLEHFYNEMLRLLLGFVSSQGVSYKLNLQKNI
jgi:hypothetical protein